MVSQGYSTISDYYNTLFSSLLNINQHSTVLRLAQNLESVIPDNNTWLMLITCYAKNGHISSAFSLFSKIINAGYRPSSSNMNDLFCCLLAPGHISKAMLLHNYIFLKGGFRLSCNTYHHLVGSLCEIGETNSMAIASSVNLNKQSPSLGNLGQSHHFTSFPVQVLMLPLPLL